MTSESKVFMNNGASRQSQVNNKSSKETVCAVVVTYNRKAMLLECLESLLKQIYPMDAIYLVDNASSDGTPELLQAKGYIEAALHPNDQPMESQYAVLMQSAGNQDKKVKIHYVRMHKNTGGAGGFYEGIKRSYARGYDWFWLSDDDTQLASTALSELIKFKEILESRNDDYSFLCSKVIGKTGTLLHVPVIDASLAENGYPKWGSYLEYGTIRVRNAPFVSVIINRREVYEHGLPHKEFFLWCEDFEYTLRLSRESSGYLVGKSTAMHFRVVEKMLNISDESDIDRIRILGYLYRNSFYTFNKYFGLKSAIGHAINDFIIALKQSLRRGISYKFLRIMIMIQGTLRGIFFRPKTDFLSSRVSK